MAKYKFTRHHLVRLIEMDGCLSRKAKDNLEMLLLSTVPKPEKECEHNWLPVHKDGSLVCTRCNKYQDPPKPSKPLKKILIIMRGTELLNYKKLDLAKKINELVERLNTLTEERNGK